MALALEELIPPETAAHTGDWVQSLAEEALDVRANLIRMIESETSEVDRAQGASQPVALSTPPNFADPLRIQELPTAPRRSSVAAIIARRLAAYLGPHTAKVAVKTFSMKALGRGPETLEPADVPALQAALRPILRQLIGRAHCERILDEIARELER